MWLYILLFYAVQRVESVRMVSIQVPARAVVGSQVVLSCNYDLEGEKLYAMKWQKDGVEFFRYMPSENPPKMFFAMQGIEVDLERSGNGTVVIQNIVANSSGTFSCEISADTTFHTVQQERVMAVEELRSTPNGAISVKWIPFWCLFLPVLSFLMLQAFRRDQANHHNLWCSEES